MLAGHAYVLKVLGGIQCRYWEGLHSTCCEVGRRLFCRCWVGACEVQVLRGLFSMLCRRLR